jgi:hypothetical protein
MASKSWPIRFVLSLTSALAVIFSLFTPAHAASRQYDMLWRQERMSDFNGWTLNGITVGGSESAPAVHLAPGSANLTCSSGDIDGGTAGYDASTGLCAGTDPMAAGSYLNGLNYYNGGSFLYGTMTSPVQTSTTPFDQVIASWNATTPAGTWLQTHIRVLEKTGWTHWYILPIWASDFSTIHRHSVRGQFDASGGVAVDTFVTQPNGHPASAFQVSVTLFSTSSAVTPTLRLFTAVASYDNTQAQSIPADHTVWGMNLNVPQRSQMLPEYNGLGFGGGGEVWCSPTSTSMVMAYWAQVTGDQSLDQSVPDAARDTYDYTYDGTGNWPFNTAYAASYGLTAFVTRMYSMSQIEQWIKAGVPIVISVAFNQGQLPGAPVKKTGGHLLLVRGFTSTGDVITNDPAASTDAGVQTVYKRSDLETVWLTGSYGTTYVMYPQGWTTPTVDALGSW